MLFPFPIKKKYFCTFQLLKLQQFGVHVTAANKSILCFNQFLKQSRAKDISVFIFSVI